MKYYPWLEKYYEKIIKYYKNNIYYRSIYIKTYKGIGTDLLIFNICKYILCEKKNELFSCNKCKSCNLFSNKKNIDFYFFNLKNKKQLEVNNIRKIINDLIYFNRINNYKIIYIKNIENLNDFVISSLLKVTEEPPINTWFFFTSINHNKVNKTLISRCLVEEILPLNIKKTFLWLLKKTKLTKYKCYIALKLSNESPILAKKMLKTINWDQRDYLYNRLYINYKNNILSLLNIILYNSNIQILYLYSIFLDALKWKFNIFNSLINIDKKNIIKDISNYFTLKQIYNITYQFMICYHYINYNNFLNKKLLIIKLLINYQKFINKNN
ncbi:DNA polymerase III subunit delta' C-terminal domain-containing protein [Candidatus Annandia pinicola]|uniref:DNA polymerase III subunit delta' C-terminal domain-containing protein n=1 Tax=Candidatus Annandia pinicola TaxID=1345117 RepID=UPI001D030EBA|nr:DNA polymerase III subunit delta' C-terminal domain-containing protein [Candidatus Annandia pinicola]UDG80392.1 DNA polymerase III subunit delta' [Candidatus Annandia pinicola]